MSDAQERFDRYFEGLWERRWWVYLARPSAPRLVEVKTYSSGEITGGIVAVNGVADDGTRITFKVDPTDKKLTGYKRIAAPSSSDGPSDDPARETAPLHGTETRP